MLDKRLQLTASFVRKGARLADVGTDHAYLPVALVGAGHCPSAIACDLREGPLENARRTVAEAGLSAVIDCRLGDGLAPFSADEVDDIVIAGMGGETMAAILAACYWSRERSLHFVFQPMTRPEELRRYLLTNGYTILSERTAVQGAHCYICMDAVWTDAPPVTDETAYVIGRVDAAADRDWLLRQQSLLQKRLNGLRCSGDAAGEQRLLPILKKLEEMLS